MGKKTSVSNTNLVFEELEPRLLLSADGLAVITESSVATLQNLVHSEDEHTMIVQHHAEQISTAVHDNTKNNHRTELVILDSRAPDFQQLHNDIIKAQQQGRDINVVILDAHRDGLEQISEALSKYNKLDAVHIVSHGSDGQLQLGATQLNSNTLKDRSSDISAWKEVFTDGGDLLIYGCNLADTQDGKSLVDSLSRLTATDVAASDDLTGNELLGGDWELEYTVGEVETQVAFSENMQQQWGGTLAAPSATADTYSVNEDQTLYVVNALNDKTTNTELEALWVFNEGAGQIVTDATGKGNDATLGSDGLPPGDSADPTWTTSSRTGDGALAFDGTDDYVQTSADLSSINEFTLSAWFQTNTTLGVQHIITQGDPTENGWGEGVNALNKTEMNLSNGHYNDDDKISFFMGNHDASNPDSIDIISNSDFTDTSGWHHVVVVVKSTGNVLEPNELEATLYVDGVWEGSDIGNNIDKSSWGTAAGGEDLKIGKAGADQRYFDGMIDEVGIYNTALTDAEVRALYTAGVLENDTDVGGNGMMVLDHTQPSNGTVVMNPDGSFVYNPDLNFNGTDSFTYFAGEISDGTTHYWNLDGTATDSVGGADGTINGATTVAAPFGNALSFDDQAGDYVEVPDITYNDEFTISFKFQIDSNSGDAFQYLYSHDNPQDQNSINIYLTEDNWSDANSQNMLRTRVLDSNDAADWLDIDISAYVNDGQWHEYTLTVSSTPGLREGVHVYLDGVHQNGVDSNDVAVTGISANGGDTIDPGTNLFIGGRYDLDPARFFDGAMQHIQIYDRALSDAEITDQHNNIARETVTITVNPVNDAPTGTDNTVSIEEDTSYTFSAADFGFTDVDVPDSLKEVRIDSRDNISNPDRLQLNGSNVTNGQIIPVAQLGNLVFTPQANATGSPYIDFTFTVFDQSDASDSTPRTMTINVTETNDPPTINGTVANLPINDIATVNPFLAVTIDDTDKPNQTLSVIVILDTAAKGVFTATSLLDSGFLDAGGGSYTYSGTAANATTAIQKLVFDPADNRVTPGSTETTTFTISVDDGIAAPVTDNNTTVVSASVNDSPTDLTLDNATVAENAAGAVIGNVSVTDPDTGDTYSYTVSDARFEVVSGQLKLVDGQSLDFETEPAVNVTITVIDLAGTGLSYNEAFIITVTDANDAPTTTPVTLAAIAEDSVGRLITQAELLVNANDVDGDLLTATNLAVSAGGLVDNGDGTWTYTPLLNDDTSVSFSYTVEDGALTTAGSATLDITPVNDAPVATANGFTVNEGSTTTLDLASNDNDVDDGLNLASIVIVSSTSNGSIAVNTDGTVDYTHDGTETTSDSFTYNIKDLSGVVSNTVTVNLTINQINDAPFATNDPGNYSADLSALNPLSYWHLGEASGTAVLDEGISSNAFGTYNGVTLGQAGAISGDTDTSAGFDGVDDYIEILHDGSYLLNDGTVQLWFNADNVTIDQALISKDSSGYDTGGHFTIRAMSDGSIEVRLQDTTTSYYMNSAAGSLTASTWHHVAVTFGSNGAELFLDGVSVDTNAYTGGLTGNNEPIAIGASTRTSGDGSVTPLNDFFAGSIDEVAILGQALTAEQIQNLYSSAVQNYSIAEDVTLVVAASEGVLINDTDEEGNPLTASLISAPSNGVLLLNVDGSFTYTPDANFSGVDTFTYVANDGNSDSNVATVTITISGDNDAPLNTVPGAQTILEDTQTAISGISVADPDAGISVISTQLTVTAGVLDVALSGAATISAGANSSSTLTISGNVADINATLTSLQYTGNSNVNGTPADSLTIVTNDLGNTGSGGAKSDTDNVQINITPVNDAPTVANALADVVVAEDAAPTIIDISSVFADVDIVTNTDSLSYSASSDGALVSASISGTTLTLTYAGEQSGSATITVTATDANGPLAVSDSFTVTINSVNDTPTVETVIPDQVLAEDFTSYTIDLNAAFDDVETADANFAYGFSGNSNIIVSIDLSGIATITPTANWNGSETLTFTATDEGGLSVSQAVLFTVNPVNDAPTVANAIADVTVAEDAAPTIIDISSVFADVDIVTNTDSLSYSVVSSDGTLVSASISGADLTLTYAAGQSGAATITVTATDVDGPLFVSDPFTVTVTSVNDTPTVQSVIPDQVLAEDFTSYTIDLNAAFADAETVDANFNYSVSGNTNINVNILAGIATITPTANWNGSETLTFTATDEGGLSVSQAVLFTINPVNDAPTVANAIADVTVAEDAAPTIIDISSVFADVDIVTNADSLSYSVVSSDGALVSASISGTDLTLTYAAGQSGATTITVTATDVDGPLFVSDPFTVTVTSVNDTPTVQSVIPDQVLAEDFTSYTIDLNAAFADAETVDANFNYSVSGNTNINVNILAGIATITPTANWNGSETLTFTATDEGGLSVSQAVLFTINPVNDAPTVANAIADVTVAEDAAPTIIDISSVFADVDIVTNADSLSYSVVSSDGALVSASISGTDLTLTYAAGQSGATTITVTATDVDGPLFVSDPFTVTVTSVNDTPTVETVIPDQVLVEDFASYTIDLNAAFADVETTDAALVYSVTGDTNINVSIVAGIATITPTANWSGSETLTFTATDQGGLSVDQVVLFTVTPVNDVPTALDDAPAAVNEGGTVIFDLAANDLDVENALDLNSISIIGVPANGSLIVNSNGTVTYTHDGSETISDSFSYTIADLTGAISNTATVSVIINPVNDAPSALDDAQIVNEGGTVNINLAVNDTDIDNAINLNSIAIIGAPANGSLTVNANGTVDYIHDGSQTLSDTFSYTIADVTGAISNTATVAIAVTPVNNTPTTTGIADVTVAEDSAATNIDLNAVFNDADNLDTELTYSITGNTTIGLFSSTAINAATGELSLDYAADVNGSSQLSVRATDPSGASVDTLFTVTVTPVNDTPVLVANTGISASGIGGTVISSDALRVSDIDNSDTSIVYTVTTLPANGELIVNGVPATINSSFTEADIINNSVSYQSDGTGASDQFLFTVSDGVGGAISNNTFNIVVQFPAFDPGNTPGAINPDVNPTQEPFVNPETPPQTNNILGGDNSAPPVQEIGNLNTGGSTRYPIPPELTLEPVPQVTSEQVDRDRFNFFDESLKINQTAEINFSGSSTVADIQVKSIKALWIAIDEMKQRIDDNVTDDMTQLEFRAAAVSSSGVALTAGVVAWVLRSGALMTSLISTIPLWKGYDPLPILAYKDDDEEENIAEDKIPTSLEEMKKIKEIKERMKKHNQVDNLFGGSGAEG